MTPEKVIPLDLPERARQAAVRQLRELADAIERAPRERLADVLPRLFGKLERVTTLMPTTPAR